MHMLSSNAVERLAQAADGLRADHRAGDWVFGQPGLGREALEGKDCPEGYAFRSKPQALSMEPPIWNPYKPGTCHTLSLRLPMSQALLLGGEP